MTKTAWFGLDIDGVECSPILCSPRLLLLIESLLTPYFVRFMDVTSPHAVAHLPKRALFAAATTTSLPAAPLLAAGLNSISGPINDFYFDLHSNRAGSFTILGSAESSLRSID